MCKPKIPKAPSGPQEVGQAAPFIPMDGMSTVMSGPRISDVDALKPRRDNPLRVVGRSLAPVSPSINIAGGKRAGGVTVRNARAPSPGTIPYVPVMPPKPTVPTKPTRPNTVTVGNPLDIFGHGGRPRYGSDK